MARRMRTLSLCSGIGGIELAGEACGIEAAAFCDCKPTAVKILNKNWPNVPVFPDIIKLRDSLLNDERVLSVYGIEPGKIDLVTCGWPCQSFSTAGNREGRDDDRGTIFDKALDIATSLRSPFLLGENVLGATSMADGIDWWVRRMEREGYATRAFVYPAGACGTDHLRYRLFLLGFNSSWGGRLHDDPEIPVIVRGSKPYWSADFLSQSGLSRATYGIPTELDADRLELLGNAVSPAQVYPLLRCIKSIHDSLNHAA